MAVPKGKALYDYVYDLAKQKGVTVHGYVLVEGRQLLAREIMEMNEEEFYKTLDKADGSFLIVKLEKEKVWIVTDWLGTRPVYYAVINNGIVFSSCLWSILRFFKEISYPIRLNDKAILGYIWLGKIGVLNNWTFIEDISLAPPGTVITYDLRSGKIHFHRYYELQ